LESNIEGLEVGALACVISIAMSHCRRRCDDCAHPQASRTKLQYSVDAMSERNEDLVRTAEKLREVLQIAGENAGSLHEVEVSERDEMRAA
jgi:hypothetical protein